MIGTIPWFKRWIGPMCLAGLGAGAIVGAALWRFQDYPELAQSRVSITTLTETQVSSVVETAPAPPAVTEVVTRTETVAAAPVTETVVKTAEAAAKGSAGTRTVTVTPDPATQTLVVNADEEDGEDGNNGKGRNADG